MASAAPDDSDTKETVKNLAMEQEVPNFAGLPDVAWVRILSFVTLVDRNSVAQTCHTLSGMFNHPSLWHTVRIILLGDLDHYSRGCGVIFPERYIHMVHRFGAYFQDLTLEFRGYLHTIPKPCEEVILKLGQTCRLESLTLAVGATITKDSFYIIRPKNSDLNILLSLVANAFRLQEFNLQSWPMFQSTVNVDILGALRHNPKLQNLEKLSLFWNSAKKTTWATLNAMLPSLTEMLNTVEHFTNLQCLSLRSTMLNEEIILELSRFNHAPLQNLSVLVTYSRHERDQNIPEISSRAWIKLHERSPELKVHFTVVTRVPFFDLASLMKLEVPVASVDFMKFSRCGSQDVQSITDKYAKTLQKFVCYVDADQMDDDLVNMVTKCKNLNYLVFHGSIHHSTVLSLANLRGNKWYHFQIMEEGVHSRDEPPLDDDVVIVKKEDGQFVLASFIAQQQEENREEILFQLVQNVSQALQQKWFPVDRRSIEEGLLISTFLNVPTKYLAAHVS